MFWVHQYFVIRWSPLCRSELAAVCWWTYGGQWVRALTYKQSYCGFTKRGRKERVNTDVIVGGWCWTLFCPGMKTHSCTQQTCKHTSTTLINNSLLLHLESNKCHFLVGGKRKPCEKPKIIWEVKQTLHSLRVVVLHFGCCSTSVQGTFGRKVQCFHKPQRFTLCWDHQYALIRIRRSTTRCF